MAESPPREPSEATGSLLDEAVQIDEQAALERQLANARRDVLGTAEPPHGFITIAEADVLVLDAIIVEAMAGCEPKPQDYFSLARIVRNQPIRCVTFDPRTGKATKRPKGLFQREGWADLFGADRYGVHRGRFLKHPNREHQGEPDSWPWKFLLLNRTDLEAFLYPERRGTRQGRKAEEDRDYYRKAIRQRATTCAHAARMRALSKAGLFEQLNSLSRDAPNNRNAFDAVYLEMFGRRTGGRPRRGSSGG